MSVPDYTLVVGVDRKHLQQLAMVWPTWKKHKPSLLAHPMIVFRDREEVQDWEVRLVVDHPNLRVYAWPMGLIDYQTEDSSRFGDAQRFKMLSGFIHIAGMMVDTDYWLKIDTDVVAHGQDDWVDPDWFDGCPGIISHRWGYTKPANQMVLLDQWVERNKEVLPGLACYPPLNMVPDPGSEILKHKRIISWCAFFSKSLTVQCKEAANKTGFMHKMPVYSQDGFMWYVATRLGLCVRTVNMKNRAFSQWLNNYNIQKAAKESLSC